MNLCVTGGAGYVGSHTCSRLAEMGHNVVVVDNLSTGHREFAQWGEFIEADIRDTDTLKNTFRKHKIEGVIHFAAHSLVGESVQMPEKYYDNNVGGTLSLLNAMLAENVGKIVVSGTCAIYGQPSRVPIDESMPSKPLSPYGETKLIMERMLGYFANAHGLAWMSLRYFNAAGASADGKIGEWHVPETHLIPRVMQEALANCGTLEIYGSDYQTHDGTCIRDYVHVDDLAKAHQVGIEFLEKGGENCALNLGTGKGTSVKEIIHGVEEISGRNIKVEYKDRRAGDAAILVADSGLAYKILGWKAEKNIKDILASAWNYITINYHKLRNP